VAVLLPRVAWTTIHENYSIITTAPAFSIFQEAEGPYPRFVVSLFAFSTALRLGLKFS